MTTYKLRHGKKACSGKPDPYRTISAPNIQDVYDGFVRQLRPGTPWQLVTTEGQVVKEGVA